MVKKPALTFNLDDGEEASISQPATAQAPKADPKAGRGGLKQIGARLPEQLYRQLKAHAALTGEQVQSVLEEAIIEYLQRRAGS